MAQGLLSQGINNPLTNIGVGLLSASGPSLTPNNLGQGLAQGFQLAQNAQQQALRNQLVRSKLEEDARKRSASQRLQGLLGGQGNETLGLLSEIAPGAVAQGLLSNMFPRSNSTLQLLQAAGIDPGSEQGRTLIESKLSGGNNQALDQALNLLKLQREQFELGGKQREQQQEEVSASLSVNRAVGALTGMADLLPKFSPSTATGFREAAAAASQFNSLANEVAIDDALTRLNQAGGITDSKLRAVQATKPQVVEFPENNAERIADKLEAAIEGAKALGIKVENENQARKKISEMRDFAAKIRGDVKDGEWIEIAPGIRGRRVR